GGAISEPGWIVFAEGNIPPTVQITHPVPSPIYTPIVPTTVTIGWVGNDPDGQFTTRPVRYQYRLFRSFNPDHPEIPDFIAFARAYPDSVRALYAPDFAGKGWSTASGESTEGPNSN